MRCLPTSLLAILLVLSHILFCSIFNQIFNLHRIFIVHNLELLFFIFSLFCNFCRLFVLPCYLFCPSLLFGSNRLRLYSLILNLIVTIIILEIILLLLMSHSLFQLRDIFSPLVCSFTNIRVLS